MKKAPAFRMISLTLVFIFVFSVLTVGASGYPDLERGILLSPGADDTSVSISWYMPAGEDDFRVLLSESPDMSDPSVFTGTAEKTLQNDLRAVVVVDGLIAGGTYYYRCENGDYLSDVYSFRIPGESFTALYTTDIHISEEDDDPDSLVRHTAFFADVLEQAYGNAGGLDLILSAGDQASYGKRSEYCGLVASALAKSVPFALTLGNHDRKGADFRAFTVLPNETSPLISDYQCGDYWFVKGGVLFMVMDSNSGNGVAHSALIKQAIKENPDASWRVLMMHHDLYGQTIEKREDENRYLRLLWSPIIDENDIDLVLLGHSHYYSVSNVIYNGETVEKVGKDSVLTDPAGTVYLVSGSINHPRSVDEFSYGDNIGVGVDDPGRIVYDLLDFSADTVKLRSFDFASDEEFNSLTLIKTDAALKTRMPFMRKLLSRIIDLIGAIYSIFNNGNNFFDLREKGYDVSVFDR